ncbi:hypothetical protein L208DRAFT_1291113 [Tricholoma matsutake]|nr:hypothetical protein L208DRAFT_1291113 [Tricholoma matsutake 945]
MTAQNVASSAPIVTPKLSGFQTALRYTGIPPSWLNKRPRLPSRNWLIFLSVVSSATGLYIYDRRQCRRIKQHYVDLVKDQADELVGHFDWPRRVVVYASKWPGDDDYDQGMRYFRKYVKPILVAAAVDFEMVTGKRHGDLASSVANDIRLRRRLDLGIDSVPAMTQAVATYKPLAERRRHELDGGIVIIGRPTFKEFMAGLKKGWTDGLEQVDQEEMLARELESDGHFDEPEEVGVGDNSETSASPKVLGLPGPLHTPPYAQTSRLPSSEPRPSFSESMSTPPATIPPIPPILLVTFTNYIGFTQIPRMIWDFFNQRHKVRSGAEAGYTLVMKHSRPIVPPSGEPEPLFSDVALQNQDNGDFDFDKQIESFYKTSLLSIPADIEKLREKYYEALPLKLATARALARGTREPTKDEKENPPPTEVELRAERMKNEQRWRRDLEGWDIVKPTQKVVWDDRFRGSLRIFINPPSAGDKDID